MQVKPLKFNRSPHPFTPNFNNWPTNSLERFIHGCWQLGMMRFHAFSYECGNDIYDTYRCINHELGAQTAILDLLDLEKNDIKKSYLMNIIQNNEQPTWIWFINCNVLLDTSLAGWLRSTLTTNNIAHVRVTFLLDSQEHYRDIFQRYSAPFYKSTIALNLQTN